VGAGLVILTYHGVGDGGSPLEIPRALFAAHLDAIAKSGAIVQTVAEVARPSKASAPPHGVVITFDDGFRSVAREAAPLLAERGFCATVFCVADHIGGASDWPSRRPGARVAELADRAELRELVAAGLEIGSHGSTHAPLTTEDGDVLRREIVDSRASLEAELETSVGSYALPYGAAPSAPARALLAKTYSAVCTTRPAVVDAAHDPLALPRVDASFIGSPERLLRMVEGTSGLYLRARAAGSTARRLLVKDYASTGARR
jgi:peptidoglycan/xylan/chitin deacetylase (PgdA/CDA1 family)